MTDAQLARLTLCLDLLGGPRPHLFDGAPEGPDLDLFVSDNEAAYRQQRYDNWLEGGAA